MKLILSVATAACLTASMIVSAELNLDVPGTDAGTTSAKRLESGIKVRSGGGQGGTPMHWMAFNGDVAGVRQLIVAGADIDDRVQSGSTPLHLAAYNGHTAVARLLVEHGAKVNAKTKAGITPLDWAQRNGHEEVAMLLIAHGGKGSIPEKGGDKAPTNLHKGEKENAVSSVSERRLAPLKYSLLTIPADSVLVINNSQPAAEQTKGPVSGDMYRIQLGAFSSERRAADAWTIYQERFPEILGRRKLILDRASVKGKTLYRVQTGPLSRSDAWTSCNQLKQADQACAVMRRGSP